MLARSQLLEGPNGLRVDVDRRLAWIDGRPIDLTRKAFDFLRVLLEDRGRVVPIRELGHRAWGYDTGEDKRLIYTTAWRARRALAEVGAGDIVEGVRGVGYSIARSTTTTAADPQPASAAFAVFDGDDPDLRILYVNDEALAITGYARETLLGLADLDRTLWSSEDRTEIDAAVRRALSIGVATTTGRRLIRFDGTTIVVDVALSRIDAAGQALLVAEVTAPQPEPSRSDSSTN